MTLAALERSIGWPAASSNTLGNQGNQGLKTSMPHCKLNFGFTLRTTQLCKLHFSMVTSCLRNHKAHETIILRPEAHNEHAIFITSIPVRLSLAAHGR